MGSHCQSTCTVLNILLHLSTSDLQELLMGIFEAGVSRNSREFSELKGGSAPPAC